MRDKALAASHLEEENISVIDVGSGTGFTTEGIVQYVDPARVTCVDQSPQQMQHARRKPALQDCSFQLGDAENIPYPDDSFDRYVSAGSIEYWPDPQRGIDEAYRVTKSGGRAVMIGPLHPVFPLSRWMADVWMLFPTEDEYRHWFEEAGFTDLQVTYVKPHWFVGKGNYALVLSGKKPAPGAGPGALRSRPKPESDEESGNWLVSAGRLALGSLAGFYFIPMAIILHFRSLLVGPAEPGQQIVALNFYQKGLLSALAVTIVALLWIFS